MSVPRERLTGLLAESALTSVELVIAPPGFGKTTLLRQYAAVDAEAVFIALPEATDLEAFVRSVIAEAVPSALHSIGAAFDGTAAHALEARVTDWLVSRLRVFGGTLIIDDFHRAAADERVARVLVAAIAATHGRMRWIVASRESPPFPMGSWIARGWMGLPITGDDLEFTRDEAAHLADSLNVDVTRDALAAILEETQGWPIGVRLALTLVARQRGVQQTRVQTRDALFALIEDEIWAPLEIELRELIVSAAMMPAPSIATLEAAGFAESGVNMARVFSKVPFIHATDDDAFNIHDLFREFIATKAPRGQTPRVGTAARVGLALVAGGKPADGLRLLIEAGDVDGVTEVLGLHAFELLDTGLRSAVNAAVAFLSERGFSDSGLVLAIRGALAFADGSASNSMNLFARALERDVPQRVRIEATRKLAASYANRGMLTEALDLLGLLLSDTTLSAEDKLEVQASAAAVQAAGALRSRSEIAAALASIERRVPTAPPAYQARILQRLGMAAFFISDAERAERLSQDAALLANDLGMDALAAMAYGTLYSLADMVDANSARAKSFSQSQAEAAERAANTALRVYALRAQYIIALNDVDVEEVGKLEAALSFLVDARTYRDAFHFRLAKALQFVATGDAAKAEAAMRSMPLTALSAPERARYDAVVLLISLLRGKRTEVAALLDRGLLSEAPSDLMGRIEMAHAYAYRGVAYWSLDRPAQARKCFDFDTTAIPQRDRVLIDAFKGLSLLPHPLPNGAVIDAFYEALVGAGFRSYAKLLRQVADLDANDVELTAAELETLREFDRFGGRAVDVAKALGKSKFTVQNQIQSAIKKLGCSGRAEALAYARQRGWLDRASN